jgi:hypothetical protein
MRKEEQRRGLQMLADVHRALWLASIVARMIVAIASHRKQVLNFSLVLSKARNFYP